MAFWFHWTNLVSTKLSDQGTFNSVPELFTSAHKLAHICLRTLWHSIVTILSYMPLWVHPSTTFPKTWSCPCTLKSQLCAPEATLYLLAFKWFLASIAWWLSHSKCLMRVLCPHQTCKPGFFHSSGRDSSRIQLSFTLLWGRSSCTYSSVSQQILAFLSNCPLIITWDFSSYSCRCPTPGIQY